MGYTAKLTIPKVESDNNLKLYIFRSTSADDINTISKVANLEPIMIIDQATAVTENYNGKDCYIVFDTLQDTDGITYNGPKANTVPITEYETAINLVKINTYSYVNELILSPLPLTHKEGIVFYYSVIAVDETNNQMTHLSKVSGVLVNYIDASDLTRQLWSCDNYTDSDTDTWQFVNNIPYNENDDSIKIGDVTRPYNIQQLGLPMVETVPKIQDVHVSLHSLISNTFMVLEVQNPWQNDNKDFNYRKLKSYKIRNVYGSDYGEFSVPTYQSELPVSIEKMVILYKENPDNQDTVIDINDADAHKIEIIRRDGIYYDKTKHKSLGYNQWNIPLESNKLAVYSESSIQDTINIQISGVVGNLYVFDIYLIDVYQNVSENTHYVLET